MRRLSPLCLTCDVTRFDAEEVVEGEGGLIHSFPYTCIKKNTRYTWPVTVTKEKNLRPKKLRPDA